MKFDIESLQETLLNRLTPDMMTLRKQFEKSVTEVGTRYVVVDNLLPQELASSIYQDFLSNSADWREMKSFREQKLTSKNYDSFPKRLGEITFSFQEPKLLKIMEEITGIKDQVADPSLYAGGLSMMRKGDFLDPHIDNSHDQTRKVYRRLNLLYYVTPEWSLEDGGNLELWDDAVKNRVTIVSQFNRLVIMETHSRSWHSVSKVINQNLFRCCVSNYNFSSISPTGVDYFHVTSFNGRPEQHFKRALCKVDNLARMSLRKIKEDGFGRKDLYQGAQQK